MSERVPCEFFLVRYVPDVVKGEFVNIGVLLREAAPGAVASRSSRVRFTRDWSRVWCMDAHADIGLLESLEQEIGNRLQAGLDPPEPRGVLEVLEDSLSNSIQISAPQGALAENLTTHLEQLMRMYVEPMERPGSRPKVRPRTGRPAILAAMRSEFERAGVWPLLNKRLAAERYTRRGDPLRIDFGYRANSAAAAIRMFQAVSLDGDVEAAKVLAYTAPRMGAEVLRIEGAPLHLTAVVEPRRLIAASEEEADEAGERYRFGVETMEQQEIRVLTINDLARVTATARLELGL